MEWNQFSASDLSVSLLLSRRPDFLRIDSTSSDNDEVIASEAQVFFSAAGAGGEFAVVVDDDATKVASGLACGGTRVLFGIVVSEVGWPATVVDSCDPFIVPGITVVPDPTSSRVVAIIEHSPPSPLSFRL